MPDTTPNYGLRIPKADGTDLIVPDDVRVPITSLDGLLKTRETQGTSLQAQVDALDLRLDVFDTNDAAVGATIGTTFTAAAGWTTAGENYYKVGRLAFVTYIFTKITAALPAAPADGNITNVSIGTFKAGWAPIARIAVIPNGSNGILWAGYADPASGANLLAIGAMSPNLILGIGDQIACSGVWMWK